MSDQKLNIQFVEEIRKRELLYNNNIPEYTRRDLSEAAWDEVGKVVNLSGAACKERWKNLRTVYYRHVKRSFEEPSEKRKKYYLMGHMDFILPYMRQIASSHAFNSLDPEDGWSFQQNSDASNNPESIEGSFHDQGEVNFAFPFVNVKSECEAETRDEMATPANSSNPDPGQMSDKGSNQRGKEPDQLKIEKVESHQPIDPRTLDARKMFLLGLVDEVAAMTDAQMRLFKRKVLKLIDEVMES